MQGKKRNTKAIGIGIIILGIIIVIASVGYFYFSKKNEVILFNPNKKTRAESLYNRIINEDLENNYPKTPEEVMGLNLDIIYLLYGDMIADESLYEIIIKRQRLLFSEEILEENSLEDQVETLIAAVKDLKEDEISTFSIMQYPAIYNPYDKNLCHIRVKQQLNIGDYIYWEYYLKKDSESEKWQIASWQLTDENFLPLE